MFDFALLTQVLAQPRLREPLPEFLSSNRGVQTRVIPEDDLNEMSRRWFDELERKIALYGEHGIDVGWLFEWSAKYHWSWRVRDMSRNAELYAPDLHYVDPTTFGRTIVGIDEFVTYNFAFFDAIPDWRYDPFPDQIYIDIAPDGNVRLVVRYLGSGHFDGALRLYPYDRTATAIHGAGQFIQGTALDRYHFTPSGLMCSGETVWDFMDLAQSARLAPRDDSWQFRTLMRATRLPGLVRQVRKRIPRR